MARHQAGVPHPGYGPQYFVDREVGAIWYWLVDQLYHSCEIPSPKSPQRSLTDSSQILEGETHRDLFLCADGPETVGRAAGCDGFLVISLGATAFQKRGD